MLLKLAQKFSEMHSEAFHSSHLEYLLQLSFVTPIKALKQLKLTKPCYTSFFYDLRHCFLKPPTHAGRPTSVTILIYLSCKMTYHPCPVKQTFESG